MMVAHLRFLLALEEAIVENESYDIFLRHEGALHVSLSVSIS